MKLGSWEKLLSVWQSEACGLYQTASKYYQFINRAQYCDDFSSLNLFWIGKNTYILLENISYRRYNSHTATIFSMLCSSLFKTYQRYLDVYLGHSEESTVTYKHIWHHKRFLARSSNSHLEQSSWTEKRDVTAFSFCYSKFGQVQTILSSLYYKQHHLEFIWIY